MKKIFHIQPGNVLKGLIIGIFTMVLTLIILEQSEPQRHSRQSSLIGPAMGPDQMRKALVMYFTDHEEIMIGDRSSVSLQTLEDEGYLPAGITKELGPVQWHLFKDILETSDTAFDGTVWVQADLPSGEQLVLLSDGSVQYGKNFH